MINKTLSMNMDGEYMGKCYNICIKLLGQLSENGAMYRLIGNTSLPENITYDAK